MYFFRNSRDSKKLDKMNQTQKKVIDCLNKAFHLIF
ncbi:MAG: hypothetical protein BAJALOKI3v1_1090012, partial [Promethearchaeota archaeon]